MSRLLIRVKIGVSTIKVYYTFWVVNFLPMLLVVYWGSSFVFILIVYFLIYFIWLVYFHLICSIYI